MIYSELEKTESKIALLESWRGSDVDQNNIEAELQRLTIKRELLKVGE